MLRLGAIAQGKSQHNLAFRQFLYIFRPTKKVPTANVPAKTPKRGEEKVPLMMIIARFRIPFIVLLLLALPTTGCAGTGGYTSAYGTFPVPSQIRDNVAFWRNVYGKWSRKQVAIHDDEYMGVIYEVASLPRSKAGRKRFIRARKAHYKDRLDNLETRIRSGLRPSRHQKGLYKKLVRAGGKRAIYGAADRVRSQQGTRERFRRGLAISGRYDAKFRRIFHSRGLPGDLAYLPHVESSFQAHARSGVGAAGMWQFMRGTGKLYMRVNGAVDERLDPVIAAEGAAKYLAVAYRKLGSWPLAITSYNHGQGGMQKAKAIYGNNIGAIVRRYKGPLFKFASRNFYAEFIAAREVASHPKRYFPEGVKYQAPLSEDRLVLRHGMSASWVACHYGVSTYRLAALNRHWRKPVRKGRARLPAGSTVWLPRGTFSRVASAPAPMPVMIAKVDSKPKVKRKRVRVAMVDKAKAKRVRVAKAKTKVKAKPIRVAKAAKVHVVKLNETLYRVSTYYKLSVAELRRLNSMGPEDTYIRAGQELRVSG